MRRTTISIRTADSTLHTALLTGWPSPSFVIKVYRSEDRITVFQTLVHTLGTDAADIQIFLRAHNERNLAEYEGRMEIDKKLLLALLRCARTLEAAVANLVPPAE